MLSRFATPWPWTRTVHIYESIYLNDNPDVEAAIRSNVSPRTRKQRLAAYLVSAFTVVIIVTFSLRAGLGWAARQTIYGAHHQSSKMVPPSPGALKDLLWLMSPTRETAESPRWTPTAITECHPSTPQYYAPCVVERTYGAMYGEELLYPDFRLRIPIFAPSRANDAKEWVGLIDGIRERASLCSEEGFICYRGQTGQNIIIVNATYRGDPPADSWSDLACMGEGVSTTGLEILSDQTPLSHEEYEDAYPIDTLLIATSPDSWSFQHFLDRVTHIVGQGSHLLQGYHGDVVTGRKPGGPVLEMWKMLGYEGERMHYIQHGLRAKKMLFSCRAPLVHPWLSLKTLEAFGLGQSTPIDQRKKIVYASRSHGGVSNGGRRVLNEDVLLDAIREKLSQRGQGEELVLFHEKQFRSQQALMEWFHENVRAVIGPHGGALFNHRWTGRDTLILEMMPKTFTSLMFWEEASILGQVYANLFLPAVNSNDMNADIPAVLDILDSHLGKGDGRGPTILEMYRWHGQELQLPV